MSDLIKHECGIAMVRLRKPLQYYQQRYESPLWGLQKLFLLMEKQHNRGQDGAGIGALKLDMAPGLSYMARERSTDANALTKIFTKEFKRYDKLVRSGDIVPEFANTVKEHFDFGAESFLGHLRYGTSGGYDRSSCHPYFRRSNWPTRNLMVAGNFNMTNTAELNRILMQRGQHPIFDTDSQTVLEEIGFHLDQMHDDIYRDARNAGIDGEIIPQHISKGLDLAQILRESARSWDGGYVIAGLVGHGASFVLRDPRGTRPAYYFANDEVVAIASERVPLLTVFGIDEADRVQEVPPGHAAIVSPEGELEIASIAAPEPRKACSFERIYFSRGNDPEIYQERKALGAALAPAISDYVDHDFGKSVFAYIPNTAEIAYFGLLDELRRIRRRSVRDQIINAQEAGKLTPDLVDELILDNWPRAEKVAHKDIKMRTFISQEKSRTQLVSHVYDITYDVVGPEDHLVVIDDSIVRGTTLRRSILKILSRTNPKSICIASTAPQIRYPDCYGIDMSELGKFIAFQAAIALLKDRGLQHRIDQVYQQCQDELNKDPADMVNAVKAIYEPFSATEISAKIGELVRPTDIKWKGPVNIIYQSIEDLHLALPHNRGDWYFTGDYPTFGGTRIVNQAFIDYYEDRQGRSYDVPSVGTARG